MDSNFQTQWPNQIKYIPKSIFIKSYFQLLILSLLHVHSSIPTSTLSLRPSPSPIPISKSKSLIHWFQIQCSWTSMKSCSNSTNPSPMDLVVEDFNQLLTSPWSPTLKLLLQRLPSPSPNSDSSISLNHCSTSTSNFIDFRLHTHPPNQQPVSLTTQSLI